MMDYRSEAERLIKGLSDQDKDDELQLKFGGDGDMGETLIDLLEAYFIDEDRKLTEYEESQLNANL